MTEQAEEPILVYWQPGCTSCLKTKEFLTSRGVLFESINVLTSDAAVQALRSLGARGVPVVARGTRFVYAQSTDDVASFLGMDTTNGVALPPPELARRLARIVETGLRFARQLSDADLVRRLPHRDRNLRQLLHHIFRIAEVLAINERTGRLTMEMIIVEPPETMRLEELQAYGEKVLTDHQTWWTSVIGPFDRPVDTFYGAKSLHSILERSTWHAAQHVRQLEMVMRDAGIEPNRPLRDEDLTGLPVPQDIWDEREQVAP